MTEFEKLLEDLFGDMADEKKQQKGSFRSDARLLPFSCLRQPSCFLFFSGISWVF